MLDFSKKVVLSRIATRYILGAKTWEVGCADYKTLDTKSELFMLRNVDEALYAALI